MKNIGDKAPEVLGINEKGEEIRLSAYKGKKIVLYFYPKDSTSGCTAHDENGAFYYLLKNSWGKSGPYNGMLYMSEDYFRAKTVSVLLSGV